MCPHDKIVIKDFSTDSKALKIAICEKCLEVQKVIIQGEKPVIKVETEKEMWANKERREHKRALTMQAFNLFPPVSSDDVRPAIDRWKEIKAMRDLMLEDLYNG